MNLHQFRFFQEAARRNLNLTETAKALERVTLEDLGAHTCETTSMPSPQCCLTD